MDIIQAIILGIVQGATEFIPVSSSGHLVLIPWLLAWEKPPLVFDTMTHWGTLVAVVIYFWQDVRQIVINVLRDLSRGTPVASPESRLGWLIVLATLPTVIIGLLFEKQFESLFGEPIWVASFLFVTGLILWISESLGKRLRDVESMSTRDAILFGLAQSMAITPGISRSGSTIGMGLLLGLTRPAAARFSFLMMIPVVFGAGLLKLIELWQIGLSGDFFVLLLAGFISAAISGYACISFLINYLATRSVRSFAIYCWLFGAFCLIVAFMRGLS
jgi:undecaprenyl-diphosphatase